MERTKLGFICLCVCVGGGGGEDFYIKNLFFVSGPAECKQFDSRSTYDLIPQYCPIYHCARVNAHIKGKISERPTAACTAWLEDKTMADGHIIFHP